jgi:predicted AlkP superfamily phosphohydrolase/phosphomutase
MPTRRTACFLATLPAVVSLACATPAAHASTRPPVVVLGFDGADAALVEQWMDSGDLPNLAALRREGVYAPLAPTNPPQTPVSWATFSTGLDPGGTTVFDFLKRSPDDYLPDFAMNSPVTEEVLFGKRNPAVLGIALALVMAALALGVLRLARRRAGRSLIAAAAVAAVTFPLFHAAVVRFVPAQRPGVVSHRQGRTFWEIAGEAGLRTKIIHIPGTFPPVPARGGQLLSGLGVPDVRGTFGTYTYYTTAPEAAQSGADTEMGGKVVVLPPGRDEYETFIYGPYNKLFGKPPEILLPLGIRVDRAARRAAVRVSGRRVEISEGEWTAWLPLTFSFNALLKMHGIARFYLVATEPELKLYMSAVNWNPMRPPLPISHPPGFAKELARRFGFYKTIGWVEDTWGLNENVINEHCYEADVDATVDTYERMLEAFLEEKEFDLLVQVFTFTDRSGHMYWRTMDPESPAYTPEIAAEFGGAIKDNYRRMDRIVGRARELLPPDAVLLVCSDHGFSTWTRSVNYNTWLVRNGYMALKPDAGESGLKTLEDLFGRGQFWPNVDWQSTRVYALGLGCLYVNLAGRERYGIVMPGAEYEALLAEVQSKLEALVDSTTGRHPVQRVYRRDETYKRYDDQLIPDLRAANSLGYRVSWQTTLGGIPSAMFEDNARKWSGDHCSLDPSAVPGILLSNRRFMTRDAGIVDLFPTILTLLDLPLPDNIDGRPLKRADGSAEAVRSAP